MGQIDGICNLGEVRAFFRQYSNNSKCGCGEKLTECTLWSKIALEANLTDIKTVKEIGNLQSKMLGWRHTWLKVMRFSRNPKMLEELKRNYLPLVINFYESAARITNSTVIVDSSKEIVDALLLTSSKDLNLYLIHLLREPGGVTYSTLRAEKRDFKLVSTLARTIYLSLNWTINNYLAANIERKSGHLHYLALTYSKLVEEPRDTLTKILEFTQHNASLDFVFPQEALLKPTHSVDGNPSRFNIGKIRLEPDNVWQIKLPKTHQLAVKLITAPVSRKYFND